MPSRFATNPMLVFAALVFLGALLPIATRDPYHLDVATRIIESLILALGLRTILSTGRLSLAHVSFMGVGAYTSAVLAMKYGVSFWVALPLSAVTAGAVAAVIGLITLRLTGAYFFLVTFAFLNVVVLFLQSFFTETLGGTTGLIGVPPPDAIALPGLYVEFIGKTQLYYLALVVLLVFGGMLVRMDHSRFGLVLNGIRQAEHVAAMSGVNTLYYKVVAFVTASAVAGVAGSLFAHTQMVVHPTDFGINAMLRVIVFVVVGGIGSTIGAIGGTVGMSLIAEILRALQSYETLVYGAVLVIVMRFMPDGIAGVWERWGGRRANDGSD